MKDVSRRQLIWGGVAAVPMLGSVLLAQSPVPPGPAGEFDDLIGEVVGNGKRLQAYMKTGRLPRAEHARTFATHARLVAARMRKVGMDDMIKARLAYTIATNGRGTTVNQAFDASAHADTTVKTLMKRRGWNLDDQPTLGFNNRLTDTHLNRTIDDILAGKKLSKHFDELAALAEIRGDELARLERLPPGVVLAKEDECRQYATFAEYTNDAFTLTTILSGFCPACFEIAILFGGMTLTLRSMYYMCSFFQQ